MTWLEPGKPIVLGHCTLLIINRLTIDADSAGAGYWLQGSKEPYALMIREEQGLRAVDMAGREIAIEKLIETIPELETIRLQD